MTFKTIKIFGIIKFEFLAETQFLYNCNIFTINIFITVDSVGVFWGRKVFNSDKFSIVSEARNSLVAFAEKQQMKINSYQKLKHGYLIHSLSDRVLRFIFSYFYSTTKHEIIQIKNHNLLCSLDPPNQSRLF